MRVELYIDSGEVRFWIISKEKGFRPLKKQDISKVNFVLKEHGDRIVQKWMDFFVLNKIIKFEIINPNGRKKS
jgi:hypothetical protein